MTKFGYAIQKHNNVGSNDYAPRITVYTFLTLECAETFKRENGGILAHSAIKPSYEMAVSPYGREGVMYETHEGSGVYPAGEEEYPHLDTPLTRKLAGVR